MQALFESVQQQGSYSREVIELLEREQQVIDYLPCTDVASNLAQQNVVHLHNNTMHAQFGQYDV